MFIALRWRSWSGDTPVNTNALSVPAVCPAHVPWLNWSNVSSSSVLFNTKPVCASLVVGGRRSDTALQVPALPTGWTAIGDPTMGHIGNYAGEVTQASDLSPTNRYYFASPVPGYGYP